MAKSSLEPTGGAHGAQRVQTWQKAKTQSDTLAKPPVKGKHAPDVVLPKLNRGECARTPMHVSNTPDVHQIHFGLCPLKPMVSLPNCTNFEGRSLPLFFSVAALRLPPSHVLLRHVAASTTVAPLPASQCPKHTPTAPTLECDSNQIVPLSRPLRHRQAPVRRRQGPWWPSRRPAPRCRPGAPRGRRAARRRGGGGTTER